ncbi:MAG: hypothetical protein WC054_08400 [Candidatus Nanopelagicales bacterium]
MKPHTPHTIVGLTSAVVVMGVVAGCSVPTSNSEVSPSVVPSGSAAAIQLTSSSANGGVGLPDAIAQMARGQKSAARDLVKKQANETYDKYVKEALAQSLGPMATKALGAAFGPLASMATGMIFDKVFGTLPDGTQVKLDQILAALDSLHADMTARFDNVDSQLYELNRKADDIITGQRQAEYSQAYQELNKNELPRLQDSLRTQRKVAQLLSSPELTEGQVTKLKQLAEDFARQSDQVVNDLDSWKEDIVGVREGTERPVPGVVAAYQALVVQKRRYMSAYEYQVVKGQALRWQSYSVLAAEVALTGARMEAADGIDEDAEVVARFVDDGGGAEQIQKAMPTSNWAPTTVDGRPDPNGSYLLDTQSGALVVATKQMKALPPYSYIQRELKCDPLMSIHCNQGRTPKWRPATSGFEDRLSRNYTDLTVKPTRPIVPDGSLVANGKELTVQFLGEHPSDDSALLEARQMSVSAGDQFKAYWPAEAVGSAPVAKNARVLLGGAQGYSYAQAGDEDVASPQNPQPIWVSQYFERFKVWAPKGAGSSVVTETASAQYKSRLCGTSQSQTGGRSSSVIQYSMPAKCDRDMEQAPVYTGYKKSVKPASVDGTVIWYVPLKPDQLGRGLNLVGVDSLR